MTDKSEYFLHIKTIQAPIFKQIIDSLKDILTDVNLEIDETGLKIVAMDNTNIVLIHLKLDADKFEDFYCEKKMYIGICMLKLHVLIKTIGTNDILTLYVRKDDQSNLGIKIINNEKNVETTYKLATLDIDVLNIEIPNIECQLSLRLQSSFFQKLIRDMHNLSEYIEIRNIEDNIYMSCTGDFCTQTTILGTDKSQNITISKNNNNAKHEIIQGVFSLKYLSIFTKCTNLSQYVELYLKNEYPLIIIYSIANLGCIRLCLSQQDF